MFFSGENVQMRETIQFSGKINKELQQSLFFLLADQNDYKGIHCACSSHVG